LRIGLLACIWDQACIHDLATVSINESTSACIWECEVTRLFLGTQLKYKDLWYPN